MFPFSQSGKLTGMHILFSFDRLRPIARQPDDCERHNRMGSGNGAMRMGEWEKGQAGTVGGRQGQAGAENRTWSFSGLSAPCSQRQLALWSGINCTFAYQLVNMDGPFAGAIILQYPVSRE